MSMSEEKRLKIDEIERLNFLYTACKYVVPFIALDILAMEYFKNGNVDNWWAVLGIAV